MVELTFLALMKRVTNAGCTPVVASRGVAADASTLFMLASDPANQWRVIDGVSRRLRPRATVHPSRSKRTVFVSVRFGHRDILSIIWMLTPRGGTTDVTLLAELSSPSLPARLALMLGARRRLQRQLEHVLDVVAACSHAAAENLNNAEIVLPTAPPARARSGPVGATPDHSVDG